MSGFSLSALAAAVAADLKAVPDISGFTAVLAALAPMNTNNPGGVLLSRFYDSATLLAANSLVDAATLNGLLVMAPYTPSRDFRVQSLSVVVAAKFVTGSSVKMGIYESGPDGWPGALLFQSVTLRTTSLAAATHSPTGISVVGGTPYWLALSIGTVALPSNGKFWGVSLAALAPLAFGATSDASAMTTLAWPFPDNNVTFPNPAPAVTSANFKSMIFPSVRLGIPSSLP